MTYHLRHQFTLIFFIFFIKFEIGKRKIVPCWMIVRVKEETENQCEPLAAAQQRLLLISQSIAD